MQERQLSRSSLCTYQSVATSIDINQMPLSALSIRVHDLLRSVCLHRAFMVCTLFGRGFGRSFKIPMSGRTGGRRASSHQSYI